MACDSAGMKTKAESTEHAQAKLGWVRHLSHMDGLRIVAIESKMLREIDDARAKLVAFRLQIRRETERYNTSRQIAEARTKERG